MALPKCFRDAENKNRCYLEVSLGLAVLDSGGRERIGGVPLSAGGGLSRETDKREDAG